ncbi:MAG: cation:dicarboxylase symporter family transporter [Tepidisphaeraceae bacterium]
MSHVVTPPSDSAPTPRRRWPSLPVVIIIFLILGGILGYVSFTLQPSVEPEQRFGAQVAFLRDIFIHLIKLVIGPLVFATVVSGIAAEADLKKVGRMGVKALIYFEIVTTLALVVGLLTVNIARPGAGLGESLAKLPQPSTQAVAKPQTWQETIVHIFPTSLADAWQRNDVLQIVTFSVIFGIAVVTVGKTAKPVQVWCESLTQVMFRFTSIVMLFAPIGVAAAMSHAIAVHGLGVIVDLGKLVGTLYISLAVFLVVVLGGVMLIFRIPIRAFVRALKEPFTIAFATTSSESALPKLMENMQRMGVPKRIVSFVIPTGYTFNLDGTTLYLAIAAVFVAQAGNMHLSIGTQISMLLTLMITSKGVAGVPRASYVILLGTAAQFNLPLAALALIVGVDEFMDMARTGVNVVGNGLASAVIARSEGEFDDARAKVFGTPAEVALDLAEGEDAAAIDAARRD